MLKTVKIFEYRLSYHIGLHVFVLIDSLRIFFGRPQVVRMRIQLGEYVSFLGG